MNKPIYVAPKLLYYLHFRDFTFWFWQSQATIPFYLHLNREILMSAAPLFICTLGINKEKWKSAACVLVTERQTSLSLAHTPHGWRCQNTRVRKRINVLIETILFETVNALRSMKAKTELMNMRLFCGLLLVDVSRANQHQLVSNSFCDSQTFVGPWCGSLKVHHTSVLMCYT